METESHKQKKPSFTIIAVLALTLIIVSATLTLFLVNNKPEEPEILTISTLKDIINISDLSTFTAVYNGIAEVKNEKKPEKTDYYVSYEATVLAGIDLAKVTVSVNNAEKSIYIDIPEIEITDINVDIASLDFIFYNNDANTSTVTEEAYKACEADVLQESKQESAIYELAKKNAINVLTALTKPIIQQLDNEYTLTID